MELDACDKEVGAWLQTLDHSGQKRPGREPGPTLDSLVPGMLAAAFRHVRGSPRYQDILTLVRAVAPQKYPGTITKEHIRQRVLKASSQVVEEALQRIWLLAPPISGRQTKRK